MPFPLTDNNAAIILIVFIGSLGYLIVRIGVYGH
jgi:hypothetical protein